MAVNIAVSGVAFALAASPAGRGISYCQLPLTPCVCVCECVCVAAAFNTAIDSVSGRPTRRTNGWTDCHRQSANAGYRAKV